MLEKHTKAIGLMSGTSADGVDVAYIDTDGEEFVFFGPSQSFGFTQIICFKINIRFLSSFFDGGDIFPSKVFIGPFSIFAKHRSPQKKHQSYSQ